MAMTIREVSMVQASMPRTKEAWQRRLKTAYIDVKRMGKHAVWLAKSEVEKEEFTIVSADSDGVFRIAKQMDCRKQDIAGENCVRNDTDELALTDENQMKAWVEHYAGLLKVEFVWPSNELPEFIAVSLRSLQLMVHLPVCLRPRSAKHAAKSQRERLSLLSGEPDYFGRNKILSGYDLSHYQVPHCIRVFFYFVWFVFIHHNFQFYFKLCTYCNISDIYLS